MAATPSNMIPLGTRAPQFNLPDTVSGQMMSLEQIQSDLATVVVFLCNHCPYVKHVNAGLVELVDDYLSQGVSFVGISSNDVEAYPEDGPERMKEVAQEQGYPFPYLYDESQEVARDYQAACTPDFYLFDGQMKLVYRGQMDGSRPNSDQPVTGQDLRQALDDVLAGRPVDPEQKPSLGCNIKWRE